MKGRRFVRWFLDNLGKHEEACEELGIEPPADGPRLFERLRDKVTPALEEEQDNNERPNQR